MLRKERHIFILNYLSRHGTAMASFLSKGLKVSFDTIRRDLQELANEGLLIRIHGGAISLQHEFKEPQSTPVEIIAEKTAALLRSGSFILTCGGEALMEMYRFIPSSFNATLLTASIPMAFKYCEHPTMDVVQIGDRVLKTAKLAIGGEAIAKIRQLRASMCILDATTIDPDRGLTESNWQIAQIKKAMVESSDSVICLAASSTIGKVAAIQVCAPKKLTYLITELDPSAAAFDAYLAKGIIVL